MKSLIALGFLLAVAFLAIAVIGKLRPGSRSSHSGGIAPYVPKTPLSEPEQTLFIRLMEALPERVILAQVAMQTLVGIKKKNNPKWQTQFNEINQKHVDFVVCRPDFSVEAIVELDDSTHQRTNRIKSDVVKDVAFSAINYPLIRFHVRHMPSVEEIREAIG